MKYFIKELMNTAISQISDRMFLLDQAVTAIESIIALSTNISDRDSCKIDVSDMKLVTEGYLFHVYKDTDVLICFSPQYLIKVKVLDIGMEFERSLGEFILELGGQSRYNTCTYKEGISKFDVKKYFESLEKIGIAFKETLEQSKQVEGS